MKPLAQLWDLIAPDQISRFVPNDEVGDMLRGHQTAATMNATPPMLLAMALNVALTIFVLNGSADPVLLAIWSVFAIGVVLVGAWGHRKHFGKVLTPRPTRSTRKPVRNAMVLGMVWGALPLMFFHDANTAERVFITCVVAGMMGGGALALSYVSAASNVLVLSIGIGCFVTMVQYSDPVYLVCCMLLVNYSYALMKSVREQGQRYIESCLSEHQVRDSAETIGLLLREFEDNSGDWIWETNADGFFRNPSKRFCEVSGRDAVDLETMTILTLMEDIPQVERRRANVIDEENLRQLIASRQQFREITICVSSPFGRKWWVFSGHSVKDARGNPAGYKGVCSDISDRKEAELKLAQLARQDHLTGLFNRTEFTTRLNSRLGSLRSSEEFLGVLYLDLDKFKNINDTLGHAIGDRVLIEVAKRIGEVVGLNGVASRFGGDEFAVFVEAPGGLQDIETISEKLIAAVQRPFTTDGHQLMIGTSIGIAMADRVSDNAERLIHAADLALYRAKADGRGCFKLYAEHMDTALRERRAMEGELRSAVANGELELHYQPLAEIEDGRVIGFEALVRWNNPRRGQVPPAKFIPLAEETGMIHDIGDWVIRQACRDATGWPAHMKVSVNLSGKQLTSFKMVQRVLDALHESGLPPQRLELEVTESVLINDPETTLELLRNLRELGVSIALDDFGTGYSSLSYLVRFPFDKLKIDSSFVQGAAESPENLAIVRSILSLAGYLNITTLAEGIETREHIELLRSEGCQQVQGFLLDKPMPQNALHQFSRYPIAGEEVASDATRAKVISIQNRLNQNRR
ncbi:EAL domain-containing protein [Pseudahrensia aquimaris]|uniref:EAL domain-containing protein n=1 Tax=Pseudahrensia aquimaris TaxID=744461 RepID=A0ABW3FIU7_9HYPH